MATLENEDDSPKKGRFGFELKISLGAVIQIIIMGAGGLWALSDFKAATGTSIAVLTSQLASFERSVDVSIDQIRSDLRETRVRVDNLVARP